MKGNMWDTGTRWLELLLALPHFELLAPGAKPLHPDDSCTAPPAYLLSALSLRSLLLSLHASVHLSRIVCFCQVGILHISTSHYLIAYMAVSLTSTSHFTTGHYDWWYLEFLCFAECLLSVSLDKRLAGSLPSDLHPSAVYMWTPSTSQANLTFKAPTHNHWTAVLSPVQIWTRERESCREGGWRRDILAFGYWVGHRKEYRTAEQISIAMGLHLYTIHFSTLCFLS